MPLRKKHVRRIAVVLLFAGILVPLIGLAIWALQATGDRCGRELAAELASRLRCSASCRGARTTGPNTAAADAVELKWTCGDGRLRLLLEDLKAEKNSCGWCVRAARGGLTLIGQNPAETLAVLNQRLVQVEASARLTSLEVDELQVHLAVGGQAAEATVRATAVSNEQEYSIALSPPALVRTAGTAPFVFIRLNAVSAGGVFDGLRADVTGVRLKHAGPRGMGGPGNADLCTLDFSADWRWPDPGAAGVPPATARAAPVPGGPEGTKPQTERLRVALHDTDLAAWTQSLPGGPVTGKGELTIAYERPKKRQPELTVRLESKGGRIAPPTLEWLETIGAGLVTAKPDGTSPVEFERLSLTCRVVGDQGHFEGEADQAGGIPLMTTPLPDMAPPLVRATPGAFDTRDVWPPVRQALGLDAAGAP